MNIRKALLPACLLLGCALAAQAQSQTVALDDLKCVPQEDNAVIRATLSADPVGQTPRLYFRWKNHDSTDFYWVAMESEPGRRWWATPAKPEKRNTEIEYYVALVDAAGRIGARSETRKAPVDDGCQIRLSPKERGVAENLTIGETRPEQQGAKVVGFLCKGIVTRINAQGIRRADEVCGPCAVVWWDRSKLLVPAFASGVIGVIVTDRDPNPSPARP
jgi:hypothetical protein